MTGAAREASDDVETVASAAEELASSVAEIGRRVNESAEITAAGARDADGTITETIRRLNAISTSIASAVEEQGAAADSSASADQVLSSAHALAEQSKELKRQVDAFLTRIRRA